VTELDDALARVEAEDAGEASARSQERWTA
jgi:hypothetical protein